MNTVAAVTILYNPEREIIRNIQSYHNQVDKLFVIDNSEIENNSITGEIGSLPNVSLIQNYKNIGIAAALNKAAHLSINERYDFLLTMDQDSRISDDLVEKMILEFEKDDKLGLLAPFVVHTENPKTSMKKGLEKIMVAMTSGCIIRLSVYKKTNGFLEKFFIDYVDNEFCLRIQQAGYKVAQLNSVCVYHKLGNPRPQKFFFTKIYPTNHTPLRWYYRTRNRLYVYKLYKDEFPDYVKFDFKVFLRDFIKVILYESRKNEKIKMIIKGYKDYRRNKFGKFEMSN